MPNESQMWRDHVQPVLKTARLDPWRIENSVRIGTPDVNYIHGWIELKSLAGWPKREGTSVSIPHFTPQQRVVLERRHRLGGHAWLLLRVSKEFLLFRGDLAALHIGVASRAGLETICQAYSPKGFDPSVFLPILTTPRFNHNIR